jgi:hypothetical protein
METSFNAEKVILIIAGCNASFERLTFIAD